MTVEHTHSWRFPELPDNRVFTGTCRCGATTIRPAEVPPPDWHGPRATLDADGMADALSILLNNDWTPND